MSGSATAGGRTRITSRALERVAAAVTGEAFEAPGDRVTVDLTDHDGALDITVSTGIRTISLGRAIDDPGAIDRLGGSILQRAERAEETIRDRVGELTGSTVRQVRIHLTTAHVQQERRVR